MEQSAAIKSLSALAHSGRLTLMRKLIQAGPDGISAGALARFADVGPSTASAQLLVLTNARLARSQRQGREVVYAADFEQMTALLTYLMRDCCAVPEHVCANVAEALCE